MGKLGKGYLAFLPEGQWVCILLDTGLAKVAFDLRHGGYGKLRPVDAKAMNLNNSKRFFRGKRCSFLACSVEAKAVSLLAVKPLLPQIRSQDVGKICVLIDLDETLVHSSFKPVNNADFIIPVEIDGTVHQVSAKRSCVAVIVQIRSLICWIILILSPCSLQYADPVSDLLDKWGTFRSRLFRESCVFHRGNYVKDLSRLGRDLKKSIIIDNSPASYIFHPDNAVPVVSWFDDMSDTELLDLIPFFERLSKVDDVYTVLKQQRTIS
ncbi:UNVERIFIED_CONTAM: hypothetical protein FKN15_068927 [Acipenser sinensis]